MPPGAPSAIIRFGAAWLKPGLPVLGITCRRSPRSSPIDCSEKVPCCCRRNKMALFHRARRCLVRTSRLLLPWEVTHITTDGDFCTTVPRRVYLVGGCPGKKAIGIGVHHHHVFHALRRGWSYVRAFVAELYRYVVVDRGTGRKPHASSSPGNNEFEVSILSLKISHGDATTEIAGTRDNSRPDLSRGQGTPLSIF